MNESARSMDVLRKLLKIKPDVAQGKMSKNEEKLINEFLSPKKSEALILGKKPGRPVKAEHLKARNFTLCLDPKYLSFLDEMKVPGKKMHGRGRKVRYIIDQFMELHRRQRLQLDVLIEALNNVEKVLAGFSSQVRKNQKIELAPKEKGEITKIVHQVSILMKLLGFKPKDLHKLLSKEKWALMSFCLDWNQKQGIRS